jgi:hypothetical protein
MCSGKMCRCMCMHMHMPCIASSGRSGACSRLVGVSWPGTPGQRVLVKAISRPNNAQFVTIHWWADRGRCVCVVMPWC